MSYTKNRRMKTAAALLLALIMLFSCASAALAATQKPAPVIYLSGRSNLYKDPHGPNEKRIDYSSEETLKNVVKKAIPYAANAMMFGDWDTYSNRTYSLLMKAFDGFPLNKNGEVDNNTGVLFGYDRTHFEKNPANQTLSSYIFSYDCRLSPLEVADQLHKYTEDLKKMTKATKVSFVGRCLGANVLMAYLYKYQEEKNFSGVDSVVLYDSSLNGVDALDAAMSGTITFENDALASFLDNYDPSTNSESLAAMLALALQLLQGTYGIKMTSKVATNFYEHTRDTLFHKFLKNTYATTPGFWSMVNDHYDEAKAYIFNEKGDSVTYAKLIKKIDNFRKYVQLRAPKIIKNMRAAGVNVACVCKYGFQSYPLCEDSFRLSDNTTSLYKQSFGATCSKINSTLSTSYIKERKNLNYGAYISPDKQLDASTGLLRNNTWYIKNLAHADFPACVEPLLMAICREHINVFKYAKWPQFMMLTGSGSGKQIVPMTASNCDPNGQITTNGDIPEGEAGNPGLLQILKVFQRLVNLLNTLLNKFLQ